MPTSLSASVIVRCKNKIDSIEATLVALRDQSVPVQIVVVDSGSTDGTQAVAKRYADVFVEIEPSNFSFGGALNDGASRASGDVHFALSAHCAPESSLWVEKSLKHYREPLVAATNGAGLTVDGLPSPPIYLPTQAEIAASPRWGFSNHASSWRAQVWEQFPFRTDLVACEDKEWSWRVMEAGWRIIYDSELCVSASHRRQAGLRASYRRAYIEGLALADLNRPVHRTRQEFVLEWLTDFSHPSRWPNWARLLSPHRAAEISGLYRGTQASVNVSSSADSNKSNSRSVTGGSQP